MSQANDSSSISFLDLLTCGLGGILLLFFIVVALREQIDLDGQAAKQGRAAEKDGIVIIHVATTDGENLFDTKGSWTLVQDSESIALPESVSTSLGSSFAVFYTVKSLPTGTKLRLDGVRSDANLEVVVTDRFGTHDIEPKHVLGEGLVYSW